MKITANKLKTKAAVPKPSRSCLFPTQANTKPTIDTGKPAIAK